MTAVSQPFHLSQVKERIPSFSHTQHPHHCFPAAEIPPTAFSSNSHSLQVMLCSHRSCALQPEWHSHLQAREWACFVPLTEHSSTTVSPVLCMPPWEAYGIARARNAGMNNRAPSKEHSRVCLPGSKGKCRSGLVKYKSEWNKMEQNRVE